jgi:hypothetical protein
MAIIETVFNGRDNPNKVIFYEDGETFDFSGVTRMVLSFDKSSIVADTDVDPALIDWTVGDGLVVFYLNDLGVSSTIALAATLVAYDTGHPDGQVVVCHKRGILKFQFVDC